MNARISRGYAVIRILLEHGLDQLLPQQYQSWSFTLCRRSLFWIKNKHPEKPAGERLKLALQELGPIHIKFGQMLSTRRDLLNEEWADQLAMLQDQVPPFDSTLACQLIEQGLAGKIEDFFDEFEMTPLASASISQVHRARLKTTGEQVVVKVLRPEVEQQVAADLQLMKAVAEFVDHWFDPKKRLRLPEVIADYQQTILGELDLQLEAANSEQLRQNFDNSPALYIPKMYPELCKQRVLVAEYVDGIPVTDIQALVAQGTNLKLLAERGVELFFTQVFRDNFFHADMHPGNILVSRQAPDTPHYIGLDCGIMGRLSVQDQRTLAEVFLAFFNQDYQRIATLYIQAGWVAANTDVIAFERTIRSVCEPMFNKKLSEISFGQILVKLFDTAKQFDLVLQPQLVLLEKTLLYVEGLGRQLYPELDLWATAKPFLEQWMHEQMGVQTMFKKVQSNLPYWSDKLPELPELIFNHLNLTQNLLANYPKQLNDYMLHTQSLHKSNYFLATALVMVICGTIIFTGTGTLSLTLACLGLGVTLWVYGWRSRPKKQKF